MSEEDDEAGEHFRESRKHLEKGTQKFLEHGIEKGREQRKKIEYYQRNRSELIKEFSSRIGNTKAPAVSGLIVLMPVFIVFLVVSWLFDKINQIPGNKYFNISQYIPVAKTGTIPAYYLNQTFKLAIILIFGALMVTIVGRIVRTEGGFKLEKILDNLFDRVPFLGAIYNITKVTTETVLGGAEDLSRPVKVKHGNLRLTAFKTGNQTGDGREIVFLPTAPNITSGLVLELPKDKIQDSDETPEEALTRILSAGFGQKENDRDEQEEE